MSDNRCEHKDPWVSHCSCFRLNADRYPYGAPSPEDGCPCERNKRIEKATCGYVAFKDCFTNMPIKKELELSLFLGIYRGIYTPIRLTPYPFHLEMVLHIPHWIKIEIGKLCRFAKFRIKLTDWTAEIKRMT